MQAATSIGSFVIAAFFLFSVVTPETDYAQGHQDGIGFPSLVESDASCALRNVFTIVCDSHHLTGRLPLPDQMCVISSPFISPSTCRAPPARLSPTS